MKWSFLVSLSLFFSTSYALVEYDDDTGSSDSVSSRASAPSRSSSISRPKQAFQSQTQAPSSKSNFNLFNNIEFSSHYQSLDVDMQTLDTSEQVLGKINRYDFGLMVQTPYDIYLDLSYWQANSTDEFANQEQKKRGNARYVLGFNWFRDDAGGTRADLYVGHIQGSQNSQFASSRNDQVIGIETAKMIRSIILGIGLEYRLTGTPKEESEYAVGNISKLTAGLGWIVSHDIRFTFEAHAFKISANDEEGIVNKINEDISYSVFTPKLHLRLFPMVEMEMGAIIRTNKPDFQAGNDISNYMSAKLLDLPGAYGNSIYTGLNFSI